jgi:hypothetical protein
MIFPFDLLARSVDRRGDLELIDVTAHKVPHDCLFGHNPLDRHRNISEESALRIGKLTVRELNQPVLRKEAELGVHISM